MVDIMKIGGVTGWMAAMAQAEAAALPLSNHTFVEPSAHVMAYRARRLPGLNIWTVAGCRSD